MDVEIGGGCSSCKNPPGGETVVFFVVQVSMTSEQQSLYKAAVQKVRDEVMAAVMAAEAASNGSAAGRNARARNLNQKYFSSDTESAMAPIPITKRKRGRPAKKKGERMRLGLASC